ncbi:hypothetical protein O181_072433 [Austropuccinia psidii MF-1]|uniref:Uncharacterized protein n=1 Tax=Austropuccinia psidii MF-1 TaxID=1389203 RepID=A0A9Q3I960_9BASI|nr:hypothetical protein [Austropuccinia psidii MF-1]
MEGAAPSRRRGVKSIRSISFSGLLCGYSVISQGPRSRLGEAEVEEGEESLEEEVSEKSEVASNLEGSHEASEAPNLALSNHPLDPQDAPSSVRIVEKMIKFMGQLAQDASLRNNSRAPAFKTPSPGKILYQSFPIDFTLHSGQYKILLQSH